MAVVLQRVVKAGENPVLRLGCEVDERVATDQEVETRDGSVVHQIVDAEDQRTPKGRLKDKASVLGLEVAIADRGLNRFQLRGGVEARAGFEQSLLVDVRGIDLDSL